GTGARSIRRSRDKHREVFAVMISRVILRHSDGSSYGNTDADVPLVEIVFDRRTIEPGEHLVLVGKADPIAATTEDMDVGAASQSTRREGRCEIACIEVDCVSRTSSIDDHAASSARSIGPFGRGAFRSMNEDHP